MTDKSNSDGAVTVPQTKSDLGFPSRLEHALKGRSGTWLSKQVGTSASTVNGWLRGSNEPGLANLVRCAEVLRVSVQWLATGEGAADEASGAPRSRPADAEPPLDKWLFSRVIDGIRTAYKVAGAQLPVVTEVDEAFAMHNRIAALTDVREERYGALLLALDELEEKLRSPRATGTEDTKRSA